MLPITGQHAAKVAELPPLHKDPFDRMLVARASVEPMILLTNDDAVAAYGPFVKFTAAGLADDGPDLSDSPLTFNA